MKNCLYAFSLLLFSTAALAGPTPTRQLSLSFIKNVGQIKDQYGSKRNDIDFKMCAGPLIVFIGNNGLHYQWNRVTNGKEETYRLDVELVGTNPNASLYTETPLSYYEQYYTADCDGKTARSYNRVSYKNIYPGIDWVLYTKNGTLKHEFIVHEGANPKMIRLQYKGASNLLVRTDGSLLATTPFGQVLEQKPVCFLDNGKSVTSLYHLEENILSYSTDSYSGVLTIDPQIVWGTYFGGSGALGDFISSLSMSDPGEIYAAGLTSSTNNIATSGSHQVTLGGGNNDAFLAKFDSSGNCIWSTYYGGFGNDNFTYINNDPAGNIYACGTTESSNAIATPGSHKPLSLTGGIFLVKFNSAGIRQWGTYYGDHINGNSNGQQTVVCDMAGYLYLAGVTNDTAGIATLGAYQASYPGSGGSYLAKFDTNGVRQWGSYFRGSGNTLLETIDADPFGAIYLGGYTSSTSGLATTGAHQTTMAGVLDGFLTKFNDAGSLVWATYYGGDSADQIRTISYCDSGVYLAGTAASFNNISTVGAYQSNNNGGTDAFVARFDTSGQRSWSTYYGGPASENVKGGKTVDCSVTGDCYLHGYSNSFQNISLPGASQPHLSSGLGTDDFLVKFNSTGIPQWATYYGGCNIDGAHACVYDGIGGIYVAGITNSSNAIATTGSYQDSLWGMSDGFLARFNENSFGIAGDTSVCEGETVSYSIPAFADAISYTWSLPGGWQGTSSTNSIMATVTQPGGNVQVIVQRTCTVDTFLTTYVTVHPLPQATVTQNQFLLSTGSFVSYQWHLNNNPISGATNQSHTAVSDGTYYVVVTDSNGCSNNSDTVSVVGVGVSTVNKAMNSILVYPNPAQNTLNVSSVENIRSILITDVTGRQLYSATPGQPRHTIGLDLPSGIYYLTITTNSGVLIKKVLVGR